MQNPLNDFKAALFAGDFLLAENIGLMQMKQEGESAQWLNELGMLYLMKGDLAEALRYFDWALKIDENFIEAQFNASILLSDLGFYEEAAERFADACQREGVLLAHKHHEMFLFFQSVRKIEEAEMEIRKAIQMYHSKEYCFELVQFLIDNAKFEDALSEIELVLEKYNNDELFISLKNQCILLINKESQEQNHSQKKESMLAV